MLFTADAHPGLASGAITATFRIWARSQVRVGGTYEVGGTSIVLAVDRIGQVPVGELTDGDARLAGFDELGGLLRVLRRGGRHVDDDTIVWRVDFHRVAQPPPKVDDEAEPGPDELELLVKRLDRMDRPSGGRTEPWTRPTLRLIAARPGVVSTELAADLGRRRASLKGDVAKLKRLGLTRSLLVGYEVSPRGRALLAHLDHHDGILDGPAPSAPSVPSVPGA
jgi:hypothetical protein